MTATRSRPTTTRTPNRSSTLNAPTLISRAIMLLAVAIVVLVLTSLTGGSSYLLNLKMANASGLRPGSQVLLGGVPVGTVGNINFDPRINGVITQLKLNEGQVAIGRGARANIVAANLLGEEYVALSPGNRSRPLPSGTTLPESATTAPTDLDQIVDVMDGTTRADLAILLDEAGITVAGRQSDVSAILRQLPLSLTAATQLLDTTVQDNHTLGDLVANSDTFISRINQQGGDLKQAIAASGGAMHTLALQAGNLARSVQGADGLVRSFTRFFVQGAPVVNQLVPVASEIADAAPRLNDLLTAVKPFTRAAVPTLNRAAAVAPELTDLAEKATPTVKLAVPTFASLDNIAGLAKPLSGWLGLSAQDLIAIPANWSKAVQYRDGLSHIFGGEIYLDPQIVLGVADKGASPLKRCENVLGVKSSLILHTINLLDKVASVHASGGCAALLRRAGKHGTVAPTKAGAAVSKVVSSVGTAVNKVLSGVSKVLGKTGTALGTLLGKTGTGLGTLLGKTGIGVGGLLGKSAPKSASSATASKSSLAILLNYLMGK